MLIQAQYAVDNGDVYEGFTLYIEGGLWNAAHDLAVLDLAPDAILRNDLDLLKRIFEKFDKQPEGWHNRGKVGVFVVKCAISCLTRLSMS